MRLRSTLIALVLSIACGDDDGVPDAALPDVGSDATTRDAVADIPALPDVPEPDATRIDAGMCDEACASCLILVDEYESCDATITPEMLMAERAECYTQPFFTGTDKWSPAFSVAFGTCIEALMCEDLENFDDLCLPEALSAVNDGVIDAALLQECASGSTDGCRMMLADSPPMNSNPVTDCLKAWAGCEGMFGENFWSEDACISLLAQPGLAPQSTACLDLSCDMVAPCLEEEGAFNF